MEPSAICMAGPVAMGLILTRHTGQVAVEVEEAGTNGLMLVAQVGITAQAAAAPAEVPAVMEQADSFVLCIRLRQKMCLTL